MIKDGTALLIERNMELTESNILVPEGSVDKKYIIKGIFMQSDIKNRNGRIYPEHIMDKEVARYISEKVITNQATGELNHPTGDGSLSINYERVSHKINALTKVGKNWIGEAIITHKTPIGSVIAGLMEAGVVMGVSSRATGSLKLNGHGTKIVQEDFKLITAADIVSDPSAPDALVTSIMEGKEWIFVNGALTEQTLSEVKDEINNNAKSIIHDEQRLINVFEWIIKNKIGK
jgi:hypothetical protein